MLDAFAARLHEAMQEKSLKPSALAEASGVSRQLVSEYLGAKKLAGADNLFAIADALGVQARWLLRGEGDRERAGVETADVVAMPQYDLFAFSEYGKGAPIADVLVPRWLLASFKQTSGLWLCEMPSNALPSLAAEGEMIVCREPEPTLQDRRIYIFLIDGRPVIRKLMVRPEGLQLTSEGDDDTILIRPEETEHVVPIGRVLASISLHQV